MYSPLAVSAQEKNVERQVQSCHCTKQGAVTGQHFSVILQVNKLPIHHCSQCLQHVHVYLTDDLFD